MPRLRLNWILIPLISCGFVILAGIDLYHLIHADLKRGNYLHVIPELWNRVTGKTIVYLVPYEGAPSGDKVIKGSYNRYTIDDRNFWVKLKDGLAEKGIALHCSNLYRTPLDASLILCHGIRPHPRVFRHTMRFPKERKILAVWEPAVYEPQSYVPDYHKSFSKVLTWRDDLVDNKTYFKFNLSHCLRPILDEKPFETKKLLTLVASNKSSSHPEEAYTERRRAIEFYESRWSDDFVFYGPGWEYCGYHTWGGYIKDKIATLQNFRFCLAYENQLNQPGWVTEKMLDCLIARCVPVYLGAPNVEEYVPKECFINRYDFESDEELHAFLKSITKEQYEGYQRAIDAYIHSDAIQIFSEERIAAQFVDEIVAALEKLKA